MCSVCECRELGCCRYCLVKDGGVVFKFVASGRGDGPRQGDGPGSVAITRGMVYNVLSRCKRRSPRRYQEIQSANKSCSRKKMHIFRIVSILKAFLHRSFSVWVLNLHTFLCRLHEEVSFPICKCKCVIFSHHKQILFWNALRPSNLHTNKIKARLEISSKRVQNVYVSQWVFLGLGP